MLWKQTNSEFPDNRETALRRLKLLHKRFQKSPELFEKYNESIQTYVKEGYARKMSKEESKNVSSKTWYLLHHPVFHPQKPGKVRVVFDAAAKFKDKSLNTELYTGPDLLNSLVGVLLRFRNHKIALVADIEAMFHQVKVQPPDRDALRFLWADLPSENSAIDTYQMLVHIFGATDSPCCANFAVKSVARDHGKKYSAAAVESILKSFYADDLLKSVITTEEAIALAKELVDLMKTVGFRLTKFISNNKDVMNSIPITERAKSVQSACFNDDINERTLGVKWDVVNDVFTFESLNIKKEGITKRSILKIVASVFDPLGFLAPFVLSAKILLQELWRLKVGWDDTLNPSYSKQWSKWKAELDNIHKVKIPRCHHPSGYKATDIQLHVFCDASELAYGAVAYLKFEFKTENPHCSFVMAKNRLAPIKTISLPRLELNAAVLGVRLYKLIIKELDFPIHNIFFWTDSTLVLQYVRNETHRFKTYVANRVTEILEETSVSQWHHVLSKMNPADTCSRGVMTPGKLVSENNCLNAWFKGPDFLWNDTEIETVAGGNEIPDLPDTNEEIKRKCCFINKIEKEEPVIKFEDFSSWKRLCRVVSYIRRFSQNCKEKDTKLTGLLSTSEVKESEKTIFKLIQQEKFSEEYELLKQYKEIKNGKLKELSPFLDKDGIMRVGGRLKKAKIPYGWKHQIILPKDHHITEVITREYHNHGHLGTEYVLGNLRKKYWIIKGRSLIKHLLKKCITCQIRKSKNLEPKMKDLPLQRLEALKPPFCSTGINLFGPILVKQRRSRLKRWGALFTCFYNTKPSIWKWSKALILIVLSAVSKDL